MCLFIACENKKQVKLIKSEIVTLKTEIPFYPNRNFLLKLDKDTILYQFSWKTNELALIENSNVNYHKELNRNFIASFPKSKDLIYAIDKYQSEIVLFNSNFEILDTFLIPKNINNTFYYIYFHQNSNFLEFDKKLYLTLFPYNTNGSFYQKRYQLIYSTKNRKIEKLFLKFPEIYTDSTYWSSAGIYICSTINSNNEIYFNFPMYDNLYKYENGKVKEVKLNRSKYLKNFPPIVYDKSDISNKYIFEYNMTIPQYHSFHYDKYRNLYYRIVLHGQDVFDENNKKNTHLSREWSIMIFDEYFNLLDEILFEKNIYHHSYFYVLEDGIYIALQSEDYENSVKLQKFEVDHE